jgi:Delta7-sterol 5-desaturase
LETTTLLWLWLKVYMLILFGYYLIPGGIAYYLFFSLKRKKWKFRRIQDPYPDTRSISRELKWSMLTIFITSILATILVLLVQAGKTKMYFQISDHGWPYLIISTVLFIVFYDTYYYWLHRFMHLKKVFPLVHLVHHLSRAPSPFAMLAFNPIESMLEFMVYPLAIFLVPLHPAAVLVFAVYNMVINTLGHTGYELIPRSYMKHPVLNLGLTVTHHEMHHLKVRYNYGIYFNIWDRIMGTNHPEYESTFHQVKDKSKAV